MTKMKISKYILYMLLVLSIIYLIFFIYKYSDRFINSDMSSELLIGKVVGEENSILTKEWYYSTELKVVSNQLITGLLFKITDNWKTVRILTTLILSVLLEITIYGFCKKINKKIFPLVGIILMTPLSLLYFEYVLGGLYYFPLIILIFLALYLYFEYKDNQKTIIWNCIVAFIIGMCGLRFIISLYLPLVLMIIIKNIILSDKRKIFGGLAIFGSSLLGVAIYVFVFSKIYAVKQWDSIQFINFDFNGILLAIKHAFEVFGYTEGNLSVISLLKNGFAFIIFVVSCIAVYRIIKNRDKFSDNLFDLTVFFVCSLAIYVSIYSFTTMIEGARYSLFTYMILLPILIQWIIEEKIDTKIRKIIIVLAMIIVLFIGYKNYKEFKYYSSNNDYLKEIADVLDEYDCREGYASFWNANVLTELSNGEEEVWVWMCYSVDEITDINDLHHWLQKVEHTDNHPSGQFFILLELVEYRDFPYKELIPEEDSILLNDRYILFILNDYEMFENYEIGE